MYYVYLLRSNADSKNYCGFTTNLKRRIAEHFRGEVHTTYRFDKLKLIYYEAYISKKDAEERERYLKTTKGKRAVKLMLKDTLSPHRLAA